MFAQCERSFKREWNNVCATANAAARQCLTDTESVMATKRFTEAVVTPELTEAPLWRHAYEKRHGYAPDAQLLTMLFSGARLGQSAYSRMMHQIALEHPVMTALVARMRSLKKLIAKVVTQQQDKGEVRITSLGCGPAKEMVSFLMEHEVQSPLKLTLIDRSEEALAAAHLEIGRLRSLWGEKLHIDCLYLPVDAMIQDTEVISALAPQHLIYSSGLLDSIGNVPAKALISRLYGRLNVNGHMALGAMVAPGRNMWSMEFVLDWSLAYRTAPAMSELTTGLPNAEVTLANDENDVAWMLHIKRSQ
ncbi:MAG TPA: hypothetical protein EYN66_22480 [Myxococcales bacterium]|nr:hypothetical protein [Myxococcales bacterium]